MKHRSNTDKTRQNFIFGQTKAGSKQNVLYFLSVFNPCFIRG